MRPAALDPIRCGDDRRETSEHGKVLLLRRSIDCGLAVSGAQFNLAADVAGLFAVDGRWRTCAPATRNRYQLSNANQPNGIGSATGPLTIFMTV